MANDVNTFEIGNSIRLSAEFIDNTTGVFLDPTTVGFKIKEPDGTITTRSYPADITKMSTGKYYTDWPALISGRYTYKFFSTGIGAASSERVFVIQASGVI